MNLIEQANAAKDLSDQQLQRELLNPSGSLPSFLALTELQRRKDMRADYATRAKAPPSTSMAEELSGLGGQTQMPYAQAVNGAEIPGGQPPMGQPMGPSAAPPQPPQGMNAPPMEQPQGFADGGPVTRILPYYLGPHSFVNEGPGYRPADARNAYYGDILLAQGRVPDIYTSKRDMDQLGLTYGPYNKARPGPSTPMAYSNEYPYDTHLSDQPPGVQYPYPTKRVLPGLSSQIRKLGPTAMEEAAPYQPIEPPPVQGREFNGQGYVPPAPQGGGNGYGGPEPMGLPGAQESYSPPAHLAGPAARPDGPPVGPPGGPRAPGGLRDAGGGGPGGGSGGGDAGAPGQGSLEDFYARTVGMRMPDRFGELAEQNRADRAGIQGQIEGDKGMALLQAGMGMLAGESPFAAVNIGRGASTGIKYWSDAQKEVRQAQRDVRAADSAIAIAQANRDQHGLDNVLKLKMHKEELQAKLEEARSRAGQAAADRSLAREMKERELNSADLDRTERRYQTRVHEFGTQATGYEKLAETARLKVLGLTSDISKQVPKEEIDAAKKEEEFYRNKAASAYEDRRLTLNDYTAYSRKMPRPRSEKEYKELPSGTAYLHTDGEIKVKP